MESPMTILVVGGDSAKTFRQRAAGRQEQVLPWSGRITWDTGKAIPKDTKAVVVVLDVRKGNPKGIKSREDLASPASRCSIRV